MNISPEKLVHLRKDRGWSQEKLAAISGISERTIQRAESDGSCSLDTKLAFATVFEISPSELSAEAETGLEVGQIVYKTDWSGALGLLVLGLVTAAIVVITGTNGPWEGVSITVVWGLTELPPIKRTVLERGKISLIFRWACVLEIRMPSLSIVKHFDIFK